MASQAAEPEVRHNPERSRYEMTVEGMLCVADYVERDGNLLVTHTEVPYAIGGRGLAARLTRGMLEDVRRRGLKVVPLCSYTASYMRGHKEYHDVLASR